MRVRLAMLAAIAVLGFTAAPAYADGTVTIFLQGAGTVTGTQETDDAPGVMCTRSVSGTVTGTCSVDVLSVRRCDHCPLVPGKLFLAARPAEGFALGSWNGACPGAPATCSFAVARDMTATVTFTDAQPPQVGLVEPAGAENVAGALTLSATASDNVGVVTRAFAAGALAVPADASFSATVDTRTLPDGPVPITATATDAAGLSSTTPAVTVTVDNTAPALSVGGPDGQTFGPGATEAWDISAGDATTGLATLRCSVVPFGAPAAYGACSGAHSHSVAGEPEGRYSLGVEATDVVGNQAVVSRTFTIDATPPDTAFTSGPENGATTDVDTLSWSFSSTEPGSAFECRVRAAALTPGPFVPCSAGTAHTASGFAPGAYVISVRAIDPAGNVDPTPAERSFTITALPPPGRLVAGSRANLYPLAGEVLVFAAGRGFLPLEAAASVPVGTRVDARKGVVQVRTASAKGATRRATVARLTAGIFRLRQHSQGKGAGVRTDVELETPAAATRCAGSRAKGVVRRLSGVVKGRVRAIGGAATIDARNASWAITETCSGTRVRIAHGVAVVRDLRRHRSVRVRRGDVYLARARLFR